MAYDSTTGRYVIYVKAVPEKWEEEGKKAGERMRRELEGWMGHLWRISPTLGRLAAAFGDFRKSAEKFEVALKGRFPAFERLESALRSLGERISLFLPLFRARGAGGAGGGMGAGVLLGGLGGGGAGAGAGAAAGGGIAGLAMGILGAVAVLKSILDVLKSSSPRLQKTLDIFGKSIMLVLKPIGDFIGILLRPLAIFMLRFLVIPFYRYVMPAIRSLSRAMKDPAGAIVGFFKWLFGGITNIGEIIAGVVKEWVGGWFTGLVNFGQVVLDTITGWFTGKIDISTGLKNLATAIIEWFLRSLGVPAGLAKDWAEKIVGWFSDVLGNAWNFLVGLGQTIAKWFGDVLGNAWNALVGLGTTVANWFSEVLGNAWNALVDLGTSIANWFSGVLGNAWDALTNLGSNIAGWFSDVLSNAWNSLTNLGSMIWDWFVSVLDNAWNSLTNLGGMIVGWFKGAWEKLTGFAGGVWGGIQDIGAQIGRVLGFGQVGMFVREPGWLYAGRNELLLTAAEASTLRRILMGRAGVAGGRPINVTVNIDKVSSDVDVRDLARRIAREIELQTRTGGML